MTQCPKMRCTCARCTPDSSRSLLKPGTATAHARTQGHSLRARKPTAQPQGTDSKGQRSWLPEWTILELFLENLCQACHIAAPQSANIEACGLCQFLLAVVKAPESFYIEFESAGDVQAVERAYAEFWSVPSAEIGTYP
jgi:hypothetical protein